MHVTIDNAMNIKAKFFQQILDSITESVFTIDTDFYITSFNAAAEKLVGVPQKEAIGKKCFAVFNSSVCEKACPLKKSIKSKKPVLNSSMYFINAFGKKIPVAISATPMYDEKGQLIGGVETVRDMSQIENLRKEINIKYDFYDIISKNKKILDICAVMPDIAESDSSVVIEGKSGTGKELFARALHTLSRRKKKPMIAVNCGALPDTLLESELFGYSAGAFTDAKKDKKGRFERAEGGTLFLDEIGSISPAMQVKLLRVLQEKEYEPLGSSKTKKADVRIIAATNVPLSELVKKEAFRTDLYYRLNVVTIKIPELKDRLEDIPLLIDRFITKFNHIKNKSIEGITQDAFFVLMQYEYPGNVRELENIIEHAFILCRSGLIKTEHLPDTVLPSSKKNFLKRSSNTINDMELQMIYATLEKNNWKKTETAKELGINKTTLWRKIKKYNIEGN